MKKLWTEFKAFAMGGNMFDLALGFILGTAFATIVESLAGNVLMQLVAAIFGQPDFSQFSLTLNSAEIRYGAFLTDLVQFLLLAVVLFLIVKLLKKAGLGNFRAQGQTECPYCKEFVAIDALKCKHCTADLDPGQLEEEDAEILDARRRAHADDHQDRPKPS
jgi:large conductance mechanosensitive channel